MTDTPHGEEHNMTNEPQLTDSPDTEPMTGTDGANVAEKATNDVLNDRDEDDREDTGN